MNSALKFILLFALMLTTVSSWAFTIGYNQAWLKNNFSSQWLDNFYDQKYAEDLIKLNKAGGSEILRMWLYEGTTLRQFDFNPNTSSIKLKPELIKNLSQFLRTARKHNLKINLTFLDGNAYQNFNGRQDLKIFWWNVFNNKYGKLDHFYREAIAPIYQLIEKEFKDVVTQVDLVNEVNALHVFFQFEKPKANMSKFLCKLGERRPVPITASLGWEDAEVHFFSGLLNQSCLDFYDIHYYNNTGFIGRCMDFKRFAAKGYKFQLGEFGQISNAFDDDLQAEVTGKFLQNAKDCGFKGALAWRFDDSRDGHNPGARYSFFAFGYPRKAYYVMRDFVR